MSSPRITSVPLLLIAGGLVACVATVRAKDAYGNNTAWTNSDSTIRDIQSQRARAERPGQWWDQYASTPAPASYKEQQALRRRQEADMQRDLAERAAWSDYEERRARTPPKPLSYREALERRVNQYSDRNAQEELGFYLVGIGEPAAAVYHLEMVVFLKKSPRAGEAAWQLFRIATKQGAQPDPSRAWKYLAEAVSLKTPDAMFVQAYAWIFGDEKLGIIADRSRGLALMDAVMRVESAGYGKKAGEILFREYAYGIKGPADPMKAVAVTKYMRTLATSGAVENWQEDSTVDLLIASPGGWAEHHDDILAALENNFSTLFDAAKAERLVRIYLGLDPETVPFVAVNPGKGAEALRGLARQDPTRAESYLPVILGAGPQHHGQGAFSVLEVLRESQPREAKWIRLTAELLANAYGDSYPDGSVAAYLDAREKTAETPVEVLALSQVIRTGGDQVPADRARGERLLARAVTMLRRQLEQSRANTVASYELARLHVVGLGVPRDIPAAIALLKSHGTSDEPPAIVYPHRVLLASIYLSGYGVTRQPRAARSLLGYPARQGYVPAQAAYADMLDRWDDEQELDDGDREEAFRYAKAAAEKGDTRARLTLAHFYERGFGTVADPELALRIYEDGAAASVPGAWIRLAELRFDESGPGYDAARGFEAVRRAAAADDRDGAWMLGRCYEEGRGATEDVSKALEIYEQSARAGHWGAAVAAARLLTTGPSPITADPARAIALLEQTAASATNGEQYNFVQLLMGDAFLPEDRARARTWAKVAAANGSEEADWLLRPGQALDL